MARASLAEQSGRRFGTTRIFLFFAACGLAGCGSGSPDGASLLNDLGGGTQSPTQLPIATAATSNADGTTGGGGHDNSGTGGASGTSNGTSGTPGESARLDVAPSELDFGAQAETTTLYVRNAVGHSEMQYEIVADVPWIHVDNAHGSSAGEYDEIAVRVDRSLLPPGDYSGRLLVSADSERVSVAVRMAVAEDGGSVGPQLHVSVTTLAFGLDLDQATLTVRNAGTGTLAYQVACYEPWAFVTPRAGESTGEDDEVSIVVRRTFHDPGDYEGLLLITADNGQTQAVQLTMSVPPSLARLDVDTDQVDFGLDGLQLSFTVSNVGIGRMSFTINTSDDWFDVSPAGGVLYDNESAVIGVTSLRCCNPCPTGLVVGSMTLTTGGGETRVLPVSIEYGAIPDNAQVAGWLQSLPPLPRVHYNWYFPDEWLDTPNEPMLREYVRITHTVGVPAYFASAAHILNAVDLCRYVNAGNPAIPATIVLHYEPYYRFWPTGAPPTYTELEEAQEWQVCQQTFANVKTWLAQANALRGTNIQVSGIFHDTECWKVREDDSQAAQAWNDAMVAKYDAIYNICKGVFPSVPVHWFARGRPCCNRYFNLEEQGDSYAVSLYSHDMERMRADYVKVYDSLQEHGGGTIIPWLPLGEGFMFLPDGSYQFVCDQIYDPEISWELGAYLNDPWHGTNTDFPPWESCSGVVFYLHPLRVPDFWPHFIAYVRGANGQPLDP